MSERSHAPSRARPIASSCGLTVLLMVSCGDRSLDEFAPSRSSADSGSTTLPALDTGAPASTGDSTGGELEEPDDPRLCMAPCELALPIDWVYEGPPRPPPEPQRPRVPGKPLPPWPGPGVGVHLVPAVVHAPDGSWFVAEQHDGLATIHHLDRYGRFERLIPLPLPCDVCDLSHMALHPSGDLLLSAAGLVLDRGFGLLAARYDPVEDTLSWVAEQPLTYSPQVEVRAGDIAALSDTLVAQLHMTGENDFNPLQASWVVAYDDTGEVVETDQIGLSLAMSTRYPLIARTTADGKLAVGLVGGEQGNAYGLTNQLQPPLWSISSFISLPFPLDDLDPGEDLHSIELGHAFDGDQIRLVVGDRARLEPQPRWVATLAFDSTTESRASLGVGPDGDPYAAVRTTQSLGEMAEPLVGLSLARWTTDGELRWHTTLLQRIVDSHKPVELTVDDYHGLIIATVVDDRLRVERRIQDCRCE